MAHVKNQQQSENCTLFGLTATAEAQYSIHYFSKLGEQERREKLLSDKDDITTGADCSRVFGAGTVPIRPIT